MMLVGLLGIAYIVCSAGLISYNNYLIDEKRFPYAVTMVFIHSCFCSVFSCFLYRVKPSLFPSLSDPTRRVTIDANLILTGCLPVALFFSAQLVLSNAAYLHSSVAFLQMMKEGNVVLVYVFSLIACLEKFSWRSVGLLACVVVATTMTIHGELHFSFTGFAMQGCSQVFECVKIVLQAMLLSNACRKLDPLTYVMIVMPLCAIIIGLGLCVLVAFPHENFMVPSFAQVQQWWPHLLANACTAFALNVVVAAFVKHSSAVAFILVGIMKDAAIVFSSLLLFTEVISAVQMVGFILQLATIMVYSMVKTFPVRFEAGLVAGLRSFVTGEGSVKDKAQSQYGSTGDGLSKC